MKLLLAACALLAIVDLRDISVGTYQFIHYFYNDHGLTLLGHDNKFWLYELFNFFLFLIF